MMYEITTKIIKGEIVYFPRHRRGDSLGKKIRTAERARTLNEASKRESEDNPQTPNNHQKEQSKTIE